MTKTKKKLTKNAVENVKCKKKKLLTTEINFGVLQNWLNPAIIKKKICENEL